MHKPNEPIHRPAKPIHAQSLRSPDLHRRRARSLEEATHSTDPTAAHQIRPPACLIRPLVPGSTALATQSTAAAPWGRGSGPPPRKAAATGSTAAEGHRDPLWGY